MSFNGSGLFQINSAGQPVVANTLIESSAFNAFTADVATGLSTAITKDGQTTITANLPMAGFKHTGVGDANARTQYTSAGQTQDGILNWIDGGGTADAITATYSPAITALVDGQLCFVRATAANATTTPTFSPNGLTARTIVKGAGAALVAGDIAGDQYEMELRYDLTNTRWTLLNPYIPAVATTATTVSTTVASGAVGTTQAAGDNSTKIATTAYHDRPATTTQAGIVELATDAEVQTGTDTSRVPSVSSMRNGLLVSGSLVTTTTGTTAEITGIPSWAKRVTITFVSVSGSGTGNILVQAGTSGGFVATGYLGAGVVVTDAAATSGFVVTTGFDINTLSGVNSLHGRVTLIKHDSNTWVADGVLSNTAAASCFILAGSIALGGTLDRVRIATTGGDTFDAGAIKAHYE